MNSCRNPVLPGFRIGVIGWLGIGALSWRAWNGLLGERTWDKEEPLARQFGNFALGCPHQVVLLAATTMFIWGLFRIIRLG